MNFLDPHVRRVVLAAGRPSRGGQWTDPWRGAVGTLIGRSAVPAIHGLRRARTGLSSFLPVGSGGHSPACAQCGAPVRDGDPFIRYRGEYYHAHRCVEDHPPADRRRRILAAKTTT